MQHTCNYYCRAGRHAKVMIVYGAAGQQADTARASLEAAVARAVPGMMIIAVRTAREWDGQRDGMLLWCNTHHMPARECGWTPSTAGVPWLVEFTWEETPCAGR